MDSISEESFHHQRTTLHVISFMIDIFRRLIGHFTPFYTPNVMHAAFLVGTSSATRKTQSFADFDEKSVISILIDISGHLNAHFTPFYTSNVMHAASASEQALQLVKHNHSPILTKTLLFRS
jgi:hypothetical protein